jgi:hypothetical protein
VDDQHDHFRFVHEATSVFVAIRRRVKDMWIQDDKNHQTMRSVLHDGVFPVESAAAASTFPAPVSASVASLASASFASTPAVAITSHLLFGNLTPLVTLPSLAVPHLATPPLPSNVPDRLPSFLDPAFLSVPAAASSVSAASTVLLSAVSTLAAASASSESDPMKLS